MKVALFAGTTEGRELADFLRENKIMTTVCVATEYGGSLIDESEYIEVLVNRLDEDEMLELIRDYDLVIDATHPYASLVTENISKASLKAKKRYLRLLREDTFSKNDFDEDIWTVNSVSQAADWLSKNAEGQIFISTGSKELEQYSIIDDYRKRLVVRVLPFEDSIRKCQALGLEHCIYEKGPFSYEENYKVFERENISWLVTKSAGKAGGFEEKLKAARAAGIKTLLVLRPVENEEGHSLEEVKRMVGEYLNEKD